MRAKTPAATMPATRVMMPALSVSLSFVAARGQTHLQRNILGASDRHEAYG
jgi:hypothetical protein